MDCGRDTLAKLLAGVQTFQQDVYPGNAELFESLAHSQAPSTLFITCADSRISPSLITQTQPGELFIVRNVGNLVPAYGEMLGGVSSAIEYAVAVLKVKNIIICGHSNCGAMGALMNLNDPKLDGLPTVRSWMRNGEAARATLGELKAEDAGPAQIRDLTENNVLLQLAHLRTHPAVARALAQDSLTLQGWYYDIPKGQVSVLDEQSRKSRPVSEVLSEFGA
ncbi:carbonic anhydrase [Neokomagataea thailandica NBRC 106555]|uniref:Carbonic anhydrase n=2 Tax=Neokomagataea TaxID=1223423 RepID=A0A4Y6V8D6_9PROT|nr:MULTISPECIES: carbonic anhydrase [Neokomagataea]QDH24806.1 carbonic anhydrase [Neokomagataea tanensis]GBR49997.1 carbonic anhydrase [Neokomagataea thailandica NBRC 106555]